MVFDEFINEVVKKYPRLFIRVMSLRFPFNEDLLNSYGHILTWDERGVVKNQNINWNSRLIAKFVKRIMKYFPNFFQNGSQKNFGQKSAMSCRMIFWMLNF